MLINLVRKINASIDLKHGSAPDLDDFAKLLRLKLKRSLLKVDEDDGGILSSDIESDDSLVKS